MQFTYVGNKADDDGIRLSNDVMHISDEHIKALLQQPTFFQLLSRVNGIICIMQSEINLNETFQLCKTNL